MNRAVSVWQPQRLSMSKAITKECMALLKEASDMFDETGCVPGINGEPVPAERIVPDVKEYISETIDDPEATFDPRFSATKVSATPTKVTA